MKAVEINRFGKADEVLTINEHAQDPYVYRHQVLIRVKACSVNPIDCLMRGGFGRSVLPVVRGFDFPLILGRDAAGVVEAVGSKVTRFKVKDRAFTAPTLFGQGTYAQYIAVDEKDVVHMPVNLTFEEAGGIPFAALTAWDALVNKARLSADNGRGKKVLVHAGSGGVGSLAIQLLKIWECYVATTCSGRNVAWVKALGADEVINYEEEDFSKRLRNYDVVMDAVGGEVEEKSIAVLKCWADAHYVGLVPPLLSLLDNHGIIFGIPLFAGSAVSNKAYHLLFGRNYDWAFFNPNGKALEQICHYIEDGRIQPVIDRVYPLDQIVEAHQYSETGHVQGKIILRVE